MKQQLLSYSPIAFEIGPLHIQWYAIIILTGAYVALILAIKEGKKLGVEKEFLENLVLFGLPIAIIGARIYYVAFNWSYYQGDLMQVIKINEGGLAIHGAFIAALIWGYGYCKYKKVHFLKVLDLGAVGFLIAQAIGRWGNFMNQEAHGPLVPGVDLIEQRSYLSDQLKLPDFIVNQMYLKGNEGWGFYHPTFLYESIWNLIGFGIMLVLRKTKLLYIGDLIFIYLIWYSIGRFFIEGMRTDSLYIGNTDIKAAQIISIVMFALGFILLVGRHLLIYLGKNKKVGYDYEKLVPTKYNQVIK